MAADDQADGRIEPLGDADDRAFQLAALGLVEGFVGVAAFVDQHHEHGGALRARMAAAARLMASASSPNVRPWMPDAATTDAVSCSTAPMKADLDALDVDDRARPA